MELYIIRHAQSTNNALPDLRQRVRDPELTELGWQQAKIVAQYLASGINPEMSMGVTAEDTFTRQRRGFDLTYLYCSPMCRALQTAQPIGEAVGLDPQVWVDIHEVGGIYLDHGEEGGVVGYSGQTRSEIAAQFPNYIIPEGITETGWWNKGREDWPACHGRAIRIAHELQKLLRPDNDKLRVALVTHGGFIDALLKALLSNLPGQQVFYHHYNTAITRLDFKPEGRLDIRYLNRVDHLSPELVS